MKRHLIIAAKCALSIAILAYLFNKASQNDQFSEMFANEKNWGWLGIGFFAALAAHIIGFVRWQIMVRALNLPFRLLDAVRIGFIGLFFNLFAFGVIGGDALRAFYVAREFHSNKAEAIASVVADRVIGLLTMFIVASIAFLMFDTSGMETAHPKKLATIRFACQLVMTVTVIGLAGLGALFYAPKLRKKKWMKWLMSLPVAGGILKKVLGVIMLYRTRPGAIVMSFLLSFGVNICFAISIYAIAAGFFDHFPSFANHFVIEPIAMVSNAVPLPGGLGGMELALDFLYQAFGSENGVVVAFTFRFALLLVSAIGAIVWFMNRSQVKNLVPEGGTSQP